MDADEYTPADCPGASEGTSWTSTTEPFSSRTNAMEAGAVVSPLLWTSKITAYVVKVASSTSMLGIRRSGRVSGRHQGGWDDPPVVQPPPDAATCSLTSSSPGL